MEDSGQFPDVRSCPAKSPRLSESALSFDEAASWDTMPERFRTPGGRFMDESTNRSDMASGMPVSDRLDSWKEIAAYLRRNERTARRWEKTEALPVYRHAHAKRDSVYAYKKQLDAWRDRRRFGLEREQSAATAGKGRVADTISLDRGDCRHHGNRRSGPWHISRTGVQYPIKAYPSPVTRGTNAIRVFHRMAARWHSPGKEKPSTTTISMSS